MKYNEKIVGIGSDYGIEFENERFSKFYNELGIDHNFSTPRTSQQNGVIERKNRTLMDIGRIILIDAVITHNFWDEVVNTTCHVINRYLIRSILNKTPYELMTKRKPKLSYFKRFG